MLRAGSVQNERAGAVGASLVRLRSGKDEDELVADVRVRWHLRAWAIAQKGRGGSGTRSAVKHPDVDSRPKGSELGTVDVAGRKDRHRIATARSSSVRGVPRRR